MPYLGGWSGHVRQLPRCGTRLMIPRRETFSVGLPWMVVRHGTPSSHLQKWKKAEIATDIVRPPEKEIDVVSASYLQLSLKQGRNNYEKMRKFMTNQRLPSWKELREWQKTIVPPILRDTTLTGVRFSYLSAVHMTLKQVIQYMVPFEIPSTNLNVYL